MWFGAKNITVSYGKQPVLKNLTVEIEAGSTTAIIGENGSGKSTLLKALAQVQKPIAGTISYQGQNLANYSIKERAKIMAYLPQKLRLPEALTVFELVSLGRTPHQGLSQWRLSQDDYKQVLTVIELLGLEDLLERQVSELSGGQQQRVWLAMILAQDTELILLDEPTTYLDVVHQLDILSTLKGLSKQLNKTIVYVLHDLNQIAKFADQLIGLKAGQIVAQGHIETTFTPAMVSAVYGIDVEIGREVFDNSPTIIGMRQHEG